MQSKQSKQDVFYRATITFLVLAVSVVAQTATRLTQPIDTTKTVSLPGNVNPLARPEYDKGAAPGSLPTQRILLVLKRSPEQEKALQSLVASQHDPKSPNFHKWLTPDQFGKKFGAAPSDIASVIAWLQQSGFQVGKVSRARTVIEFSGTAAQVQQAFHTQIHQYEVKGKQYWANASAPQIPAALARVVAGVASLNNFTKHPASRVLGMGKIVHEGTTSKLVPVNPDASFGANFIAPGDFWTIYNATPLIIAGSNPIDGTGQTIAIVGRSDILTDDISGFRSTFLPAPYSGTVPFNQINNGPDPGSVDGDNVENTLDVEWSSALAPAATIDLVVSQSTATTDGVDLSALYIVDNNLAPVMSSSYGLCEAGLGTTENQFLSNLWEQAAAQGITSMVSAGDNGSAGCDNQNASGDPNNPSVAYFGLQVNGLSSTPYNVSVGGNELTNDSSTYWGPNQNTPGPFTSALSYIPEAVWNESCSPTDTSCGGPANASLWAGSGGASGCLNPTFDQNFNLISCQGAYAKPSWQSGVVGIPSDSVRDLPDVSFTAAGHDGYILCFGGSCQYGSFYAVGGTSASSPAFAGVMSLVNQKTGSPQGQANYVLYTLAANEYGSAANPNTGNLASCNASNGNAVGSSCVFYDVTAGTNAVSCAGGTFNCSSTTPGTFGTLNGYNATPGYDQATGLGSVNITNLVNSWSSVTTAATTTRLAVTPTSGSIYGQGATVTITVAASGGSGTPTGQVALVTNSSDPSSQGVATVTLVNEAFSGTISSLPAGSYTLYARYAGDGTFGTSTSAGVVISVNPGNSTTTTSVTGVDLITQGTYPATAIPYGSNVVVSASVAGVAGLAVPTGTVAFKKGGTTLSSGILDGNSNTSYANAQNAVGSYSLVAEYSGDHNYNPSLASPSFTVIKGNTSIRLLSSAGIVVGSSTATLTALVKTHSFQASPTGTLTFFVGGTQVGTAPATTVTDPVNGASDATATFTLTGAMLAAGANSITAVYAGDGNYNMSTSTAVNINYAVTGVPNTVTLTATPTTVTYGQTVTLTTTATATGFTATGGTVTFYDGTRLLKNVQVVGDSPATGFTSGTATLKLRLAPGNHSITAVYNGVAGALVPVTSTAAAITVTGTTASAATLTAKPDAMNPANYDFTANVLGYGFSVPSQTVDFAETSVVSDLGQTAINPASAIHTVGTPVTNPNNGISPFGMVITDLNGDGIPDVATGDVKFAPSTASVYIGKGDGTFNKPVTYPVGYFPYGIVAGDFNNDGIPDLAVTNQGDTGTNGSVSILLGNGDGTFQQQITYQTGIYAGLGVTADFNHDGILDLAILDIFYGNVQIAFGNGDGTFTKAGTYAGIPPTDLFPGDLKIGDLNGDGNPDLVVVDTMGNQVDVLLGNSDGTFQPAAYYPAGISQGTVEIGDVNNDGRLDIVVNNYSANTIGVLLGNGDGTFQPMLPNPVSTGGAFDPTVYLADMNGDGKLDVVGASYYYDGNVNLLQIFSGNGDGTFQAPVNYTLPQSIGQSAVTGDLNGDGTPDVLVAQTKGDYSAGYLVAFLNGTQATTTITNVPVAGALTAPQMVVAKYSGDTNYAGSTSATVNVNGSGVQATPQIVWVPSTTSLGVGLPIGTGVLDATTVGGVAGTFAYSAQLSGGQPVTITATSTLTAGNYTLISTFTPTDTADYTSASTHLAAVVGTPDYSVAGPTNPLQITAGQTGTATFTVTPQYQFNSAVSFSCGTLPPGVTCSFSPDSVTGSGSTILTITTTAPSPASARNRHIGRAGWWTLSGISAMAGFFLIGFPGRRRMKATGMLVMLCLVSFAVSCGSGGSSAKASTTTALASSSIKSASGSSVTLTATITSTKTLTGTVTFAEGSTTLGSSAVADGQASLQLSSLSVGTHSITAAYGGDSSNNSSTSEGLNQVITGNTNLTITATSGSLSHTASLTVVIQ